MTIGERIRNRRKQLGLSPDALAEKLNVNRATVYRYEGDYIKKVPTTVLENLAIVLHTTPAYLMGWEEIDEETAKKDDILTDIILQATIDDELHELIRLVSKVPPEQRSAVKSILSALSNTK